MTSKTHKCEKCNYATPYKSNYTRHLKSQRHNRTQLLEPVNFKCEKCNYQTDRKSNYTRHCKSKKHTSHQPQTGGCVKKIYECLACNKTFRSRVNCLPHLRNPQHQDNVRKKYPETLYANKVLNLIDVKQCHVYFRRNGLPINVKLPLKGKPMTKRLPKVVDPVVEEPQKEEIKFEPITTEEIDMAEIPTRRDLTSFGYIGEDKIRSWLCKIMKLCRSIGFNIDEEGIELLYDDIETMNDFIEKVKDVILDDKYMSYMYGITW